MQSGLEVKIITYTGTPPTNLGAPDVAKLIKFFEQQNEVLRLALTTVVLIPEGTKLRENDVGVKE